MGTFIVFLSMVYSYNPNPQHKHSHLTSDCSRHQWSHHQPNVRDVQQESHFALCKVVSLQVHDLQFGDAGTELIFAHFLESGLDNKSIYLSTETQKEAINEIVM